MSIRKTKWVIFYPKDINDLCKKIDSYLEDHDMEREQIISLLPHFYGKDDVVMVYW